MRFSSLEVRDTAALHYPDVFTPAALGALEALAPFDDERRTIMAARLARRSQRARDREPIGFLDPASVIPRTRLRVQDAREGRFTGSAIPDRLRRQWIQGTGPAARPRAPIAQSLRNVAYALLSGADG